jgi:hypothetical protein
MGGCPLLPQHAKSAHNTPAPKRTVALVARRSTARLAEFSALAEHVVEIRRARRGKVMTSIGRRA